MNNDISNLLLAQFSEFVAAHMGLHFPAERWPDLQRGIRNAAPEFGFADEEPCVRWLMSTALTRQQIEVLAGNLTVGETYFFREKQAFEVLAERVLPELVQSRRGGERQLRVWSAACCTGEEAYSLAITLRRAIPDLKDWQVTILATDVNARFLHKAAVGVFGEWSFRGAPEWLKDEYFQRVEAGRYAILPDIRQMVRFEHLNLAEDAYPSLLTDTNAMDLIFCRNVLMYFTPAKSSQVLAQLHRSLVDGGWLALSATETSLATSRQFTVVSFDGATLHRKTTCTPTSVVAPVAPVVWELPASAPLPKPTVEPPRTASPADGIEVIRLTRELANQGRLAEALTSAERLVLAEKLNPVAHYLRAMILQEQGALPEAAKALQRAVYLDHDFIIAHFALGNLARIAGRLKEAERHFTNTLYLLDRHGQDDILSESEGMTAGRLSEIIGSIREEALAS
ncbi:MAG: CheR family methyltransferase [Kiritimatiellia bacterium]